MRFRRIRHQNISFETMTEHWRGIQNSHPNDGHLGCNRQSVFVAVLCHAIEAQKAAAWRRDRNTVAPSLSRDGAGSQQDTYGSVLAASGKVASGGQITSSGSQLICQRRSARALTSSSLCQQAPSLRVRITRRQRAIALAMLRRTKASLRHGIAVAAWPKLGANGRALAERCPFQLKQARPECTAWLESHAALVDLFQRQDVAGGPEPGFEGRRILFW